MGSKDATPVDQAYAWVRKQSMRVKSALIFSSVMLVLVLLKFLVKDHNYFFVGSEFCHIVGILVLIYKLSTQKTCTGLSLKMQELTAVFVGVRLLCSLYMEGDIHTFLDLLTLGSTVWVIYMMKYKLKKTYIAEMDNMNNLYLLVPCGVLAFLIHPFTRHAHISRMMWAFCVYLEAISVMPQLRFMQNAKMVEPFTAHYVFALGVARFLSCAHWLIQIYDTSGKYLFFSGYGFIWPPMVVLSEIVQTFILADFCYYYVKSLMSGQILRSLPLPV